MPESLFLFAGSSLRLVALLFFNSTRFAVTHSESTTATLSPRIIRGDKVLLTDYLRVTAMRVPVCRPKIGYQKYKFQMF